MEQAHKNPYRPRSMLWALMEEDYSDLTIEQIAEVFDTGAPTVYSSITRIKRETSYEVPYKHIRNKKKRRWMKWVHKQTAKC